MVLVKRSKLRIRRIKREVGRKEGGLFTLGDAEKKKRKNQRERKKGEGEIARIQAKTNTILTKEGRFCIPKSSHHQKLL